MYFSDNLELFALNGNSYFCDRKFFNYFLLYPLCWGNTANVC